MITKNSIPNDTKAKMSEANTERIKRPVKINCDEEAWLIARLGTLCKTILKIESCKIVSADEKIIKGAMTGAIHGAALEILDTLGLKPEMSHIKYSDSPMRSFSDFKRRLLVSLDDIESIGQPYISPTGLSKTEK